MAQKTFLREATGLVRDFGTIDALLFAIGAIIGPFWVVGFSSEWYLFPGVNIPASLIIVSFLGLANGVYYILITSVIPRSAGGSYGALSRAVHPLLGMVMSLIFSAGLLLNIGFIADITFSVGIASPLTSYATVTGNTGLASLATTLATPTVVFGIGTVFIVLIALIAAAGTRAIILANKIAFVVGTAGILALIGILVTTTTAHFQTVVNGFAGSNVYQNITSTAPAVGMKIPSSWVEPTILSLPVSFFIILGYAFNTYYAGEIRRVTRSMTIAVVGAIIFAGGFFSLLAWLMEYSFGSNFIVAANYLFNEAPSKYPLSIAPYVNSLAALVDSNPLVNILIMANFVAWGYFLIINFIFIPSRNFLAYSMDGVFPARLGAVSDRYHSPVVSIAVCSLIGIGALAFLVYLPTVGGAVNVTYLIIGGTALDGLAGVALVLRKKRTFEEAPPIAKKKVAGIPVIAILGAYSVVFILSLIALALFNPVIIGPLGLVTDVTTMLAILVAVVSYFGMKQYNKRRGIDVNLAFKEIPPE
ncbi:MAG: amino acid permease [Nitrososphaerota archaeon]|nr:amino acid permease [Nitrososphaerota archaeon]